MIRCKCRSDSQNQCSKACSCRKHEIQCMSACGGCHGAGCSNSAVDNFDMDTGDEDGDIFGHWWWRRRHIWTLVMKTATYLDNGDEDGDIFVVSEDYIVWSYHTFINIIPLWTATFKKPSFLVFKKTTRFFETIWT